MVMLLDITNCEVCNGNGVINRIMQTPIGVIQQSFLVIIVMVLVVRLLTVLTVMVLVVKVLKKLSKLYHRLGLGRDSAFIMHGKGQAIKSGKCGDLIINVSEIHMMYMLEVDII
jgi:DnaJ-class molecular chaperone